MDLKNLLPSLPETSWNSGTKADEKREMIENTWQVRFRALALGEPQARHIERLVPRDENVRTTGDDYQISLSSNSIFVHEFGAWTDPGYAKFYYDDQLYYVNVALGVQLTASLYNRSDDLSHMAKIAIVLKDELGTRETRARTLVVLEGKLQHRAA